MDRVTIIAEAGVNHNGDLDTARRLVDAAAEAGADYVKFQTFRTEHLVSRRAPLAEYQRKNIGAQTDGQYDMLKRLELTADDHFALMDYCRSRGIKFLSTAFDLDSVDYLATLHLGLWKIPSGEITNYPYLERIARYGGKMIMSTGMSEYADIAAALDVLTSHGVPLADITLLHCNTEYPTPLVDVNLRAMPQIGRHFGVKYGYSDHTVGYEVAMAAVAMGASLVEKHITLDRSLPGPDQKASLEPAELKSMVRNIRNIEQALGTEQKHVTDSERKNMAVARKSIVAATRIDKGEVFTADNICAKRPGTGISAMLWPKVIGLKAKRDFLPDELIEL